MDRNTIKVECDSRKVEQDSDDRDRCGLHSRIDENAKGQKVERYSNRNLYKTNGYTIFRVVPLSVCPWDLSGSKIVLAWLLRSRRLSRIPNPFLMKSIA